MQVPEISDRDIEAFIIDTVKVIQTQYHRQKERNEKDAVSPAVNPRERRESAGWAVLSGRYADKAAEAAEVLRKHFGHAALEETATNDGVRAGG